MKFSLYAICPFAPLLALANNAQAIDVQPGAIRSLKPGLTLFQFTYQYIERGDRYTQGIRQSGSPLIVSSQYIATLGQAFEIAGRPAYTSVATPAGSVSPQGSLSGQPGDSGIGDSTIIMSIWPYADRASDTYVGVAAYLFAPTGSYDHNRSFNMGENRYKTALQAGYHAPVSGDLSWMGALDALWFGNNPDYGARRATLEQQALYSGQIALRYDATQTLTFAAAYFYTTGGETRVNGVYRNDALLQQRYQLSASTGFSFGRLTLQYGGDIQTENGYRENHRLLLRYGKLF